MGKQMSGFIQRQLIADRVGKSVICEVTCRTGRRVILPFKWKIFKYRTSCGIIVPFDLRNGGFTGGNPQNMLHFKNLKKNERENKLQYTYFLQFFITNLMHICFIS
jgi:hypothetical protein